MAIDGMGRLNKAWELIWAKNFTPCITNCPELPRIALFKGVEYEYFSE
jgi:hypothetical protein